MTTHLSEYWIIHDTLTICEVSEQGLILFRCAPDYLSGKSLVDIIASPDMAALVRLRMAHIREKGDLREQDLPLLRPDGSVFWGTVITRKLRPGLWISFLTYKGESDPDWHET